MIRHLGIMATALMAFVISGCSATATSTTLTRPGQAGQAIYQISEQQAFTTALEAYAALYPKQSVDDIVEGGRRGYNADEYSTFGDAWWHHRILVIPAIGTEPNGNEVRGYWYDYSGGGTLSARTKRTTGLIEFIRGRLESTTVVVTSVRDGQYETDGKAYLGLKRDARDILQTLPR
jgi:hypothetical protein